LRQDRDPEAALARYRAVVGLESPGQDAEECRFTGAVAPHQADAFAFFDTERDVLEQRRAYERLGDAVEGYYVHA